MPLVRFVAEIEPVEFETSASLEQQPAAVPGCTTVGRPANNGPDYVSGGSKPPLWVGDHSPPHPTQ